MILLTFGEIHRSSDGTKCRYLHFNLRKCPTQKTHTRSQKRSGLRIGANASNEKDFARFFMATWPMRWSAEGFGFSVLLARQSAADHPLNPTRAIAPGRRKAAAHRTCITSSSRYRSNPYFSPETRITFCIIRFFVVFHLQANTQFRLSRRWNCFFRL